MSASAARFNGKGLDQGDIEADPLLGSLPEKYLDSLDTVNTSNADFTKVLLGKTSLEDDRKTSQYENKIERKSMLLHPTSGSVDTRAIKAARLKQRLERKRKPRPLSAKEKRQFGLHLIPPECHKYSIYTPLHELWTGYIREITQTGGNEAKLLKADYHGAQLRVVKSSSPSMLFLSGIVIKETRHTFVICTQDDKIKTIPKRCTVFEFTVHLSSDKDSPAQQLMTWEVQGEHFGFRAAERVGKKFKGKASIDF